METQFTFKTIMGTCLQWLGAVAGDRVTRKFTAFCGVLAAATFAAMLILLAAATPGYSHLTQPVSELGMSNAPHAFLWNLLGFGLVGVLILVFASGVYFEFNGIRGGRLVSMLTGASGLGYIGLGIFPAAIDFQPSTATTLHTIMVMISFFAFIAASICLGVIIRHDLSWKRWAIFSAVMGAIGLFSYAIPRSIPLGASQRIALGANFLWLLVMGYALLRRSNVKG